MRYSSEIKKFLYSQYFLGGLRIAIGISLPPILCLLVFQSHDLAFTISAGSLGACAIDMPGPLKYKHNEMLAGSLLGFFGALLTGLASPNLYALGLTIIPVTFVLSLITVYGKRWPQISFAALFMMVMSLVDPLTPLSALINASLMLIGGLWYTYWSTVATRLLASRIERQALAESAFACADYLLARADFYDTSKELDECWRDLVTRQIAAVETQETARDIVLRNLPDLQQGRASARRTATFNLFINIVDLHEMFVSAHTDYQLVREVFGKSDLMVFYRDLLRKIAAEIEEIGFAVLEHRKPVTRVSTKAELRAIEYEIELMRQRKLRETQAEAYASILSTYRRVWSASRLIDRMRRNFTADLEGVKPEIRVDRALRRFLQPRRLSPKLIFSNLNLRSPSFRHALRVTIAVTAAFWLGRLLPLTNAYWVVMTCIIILKPGYSQTKQRNTQRIIGTLIGCALVVALILTVKSPWILAAVMFASMVLSYSFLLFNYATSVVFTSAYVLLMFHLLAPNSLALIGERAVDTALGCLIAIASSRLFPYWEYRAIGPLVQKLIANIRRLLAVAAPTGRPAGAQTDPDADYSYRLARKESHMAFSNLGQAFQRMMIEPKAHQRFVPELNDLLVQSHVLGAEITAAAPLLRGLPADTPARAALNTALAAIDEQLEQALSGQPPSADQIDTQRRIHRTLDTMVVEAEAARGTGADETPDLKVLAHQCKQMLAAAMLVRKDAGVVRLLPGAR